MANEVGDQESIRTIIARYEAEEDEFLRELAQIEAECAKNERIEAQEKQQPMLGTLCTLIGEINKLRRENRRLKRRFNRNSGGKDKGAENGDGLQQQRTKGISNILALSKRILPPSSNSGPFSCLPIQQYNSRILPICCPSSNAVSSLFSRQLNANRSNIIFGGARGAQEQLSSPPPQSQKFNLSMSAYSADISSDCSLLPRQKLCPKMGNTLSSGHPRIIAEFDDDNDWEKPTMLEKGVNSRRGMGRRADERKEAGGGGLGEEIEHKKQQQHHYLRLSSSMTTTASGTSPSGCSSASSSVGPSLDGIGGASSAASKKGGLMSASRSSFMEIFGGGGGGGGNGKWAFSGLANAVDSLVASRKRKRQQQQQKCAEMKAQNNNYSPPYSPAQSPFTTTVGYSSGGEGGGGNVGGNGNLLTRNWRRKKGGGQQGQRRPQSCFLEANEGAKRWAMERVRTKSCRNMIRAAEEDEAEKEEMRLEMDLLKSRNTRLIEQLREKSSRLSMADAKLQNMAQEIEELKRMVHFNAKCLQMGRGNVRAEIGEEAEWMSKLRTKMQALKLDAQRQQQIALEAARRDREALDLALERVERLQRDNFLLQSHQMNEDENGESSKLMPSFDALYSFAAGLVKKLSQMRRIVAQKCADELQIEFDLLFAQSQLLVAQAQIERQRAQLNLRWHMANQRPTSFHGQSLNERIAHCRFLPFKLHGQRIEQERRNLGVAKGSENPGGHLGFDALVEANEQCIEREFMRLFDSARSLSRICCGDEQQKRRSMENGGGKDFSSSPPLKNRRIVQRRTQSGGNCEANSVGGHPISSFPSNGAQRLNSQHQQQKQQNTSSNNSPNPSNNHSLAKFHRLSSILGANFSPIFSHDDDNQIGVDKKCSAMEGISAQNSHLRPPTPSAPPISMLQSSICSGQSRLVAKDISPSRFGFYANKLQPTSNIGTTFLIRRPLTRSSGSSESPLQLGMADKLKQHQQQQNNTSASSNGGGGNRSASMSRLPRAMQATTKTTTMIAPKPKDEPTMSSPLAKAIIAEKSVKKAGNSWLSRLRRKSSTGIGNGGEGQG